MTPTFPYDDYDYGSYEEYGKVTVLDSLPLIDSLWAAIPPQEKRSVEVPASPSEVSRFLNGETGLEDEIVQILDTGNDSLVSVTLYELQGRWPEKVHIADPGLIQAIFRTIDRKELRYTAFQTIGYLDLPGFPAHFDSLLRSDAEFLLYERLRYWLTVQGDQLPALEYLIEKTKDPLLDQNTKNQIIFSINDFLKEGNAAVKASSEGFLLDYIESRMEVDQPIDSISGPTWEDPFWSALSSLMLYGTSPSILNLAKAVIEDETDNYSANYAKVALFRLNPVDSFQQLSGLYQEAGYSQLFDIFDRGIFPKTKDSYWVQELLTYYNSDGEYNYTDAELASRLIKMGYTNYEKQVAPWIKNEAVKGFMEPEFRRLTETQEGFVASLQELGLIDVSQSKKLLALELEVDTTFGTPEIVDNLLEKGGLIWETYSEFENHPLDYDSIFNELTSIANIDFPEFEFKIEYLGEGDMEGDQHRIYIKTDSLLFFGDTYLYNYGYYDLDLVQNLLNELLERTDITKRFLSPYNDGEYYKFLFGEEKSWQAFYDQYGMEYSDYDYDY